MMRTISLCLLYTSINSITKYELYYFAGAFYNMMLCWLEGGAKETPEAMAEEFLRIMRG